jgi:23S rRNA (pseudouridine1915-N3)-methyltransferase
MGRKLGIDELTVVEVEDRKSGPGRREREGTLIADQVPDGAFIMALDERGDDITSAKLAERIRARLDAGTRDLAFIIGGADGLSASAKNLAKLSLAFGRATWPHLLVRAMLAEQLYRAVTILSNHPYHRS